MNREWNAKWIGPETGDDFHPVIFKDFFIDDPIKKATLYITGLGFFEAYINGARVSGEYLTPGKCSLVKGLPYYEYDVTELLNCGPDSEANSIDVFLGDGYNKAEPERFALKAELEVEVWKNQQNVPSAAEESWEEEAGQSAEADLEEEQDEITDKEYSEEGEVFLAMKGETKSKAASSGKPFELDDMDDLEGFLERVIDEEPAEKKAAAHPAPARRRSPSFFTMNETVDKKENTQVSHEENAKADAAPVKEAPAVLEPEFSEAELSEALDEAELDIFEFEDWDEIDPTEVQAEESVFLKAGDLKAGREKAREESAEQIEDKPEPIEAEAAAQETAAVMAAATAALQAEEESEKHLDMASENQEEPAVMQAEPEMIAAEEITKAADEDEQDLSAGPIHADLDVEPYGITDAEIEALFDDITIDPESASAAETTEPAADENAEAEPVLPTAIVNEEPAEDAGSQIPNEDSEDYYEKENLFSDEEDSVPEAELDPAQLSAEEIEELMDDSFFEEELKEEDLPVSEEPEEKNLEAAAGVAAAGAAAGVIAAAAEEEPADEDLLEAIEEAAEETEVAAAEEEPADEDLLEAIEEAAEETEVEAPEETAAEELAGAVAAAAVLQDAEQEAADEAEQDPLEEGGTIALVGGLPFVVNETKETPKAYVDESLSDDLDGIVHADEQMLSDKGNLVGGLPLAAEDDAEKASGDLMKEWEDAASADSATGTTLVGGLPFAVKPVAEAVVGTGLAEAVDNVAKNEDVNIATEGELVGGLSISDKALEGIAEEPEEEKTVTLVGGLPFFIDTESKEPEALVNEELSEAVESVDRKAEPMLASGGALVGGLPVQVEKESETFVIATDETWGYYASDIEASGIGNGEVFNRLLWTQDENQEKNVRVLDLDIPLYERDTLPVVVKEQLKPTEILPLDDGTYLLDFGVVFVGFVSFRSSLSKGARVELEFSKDRTADSGNAADSTFVYISDGVPETVAPHFTCFEGRFVKLTGWEGEPEADDFTGCVLYSDMKRTGFLETSSEALNRLYEEVLMEQKRVSLIVPDDATQRTVYAFAPAASYNMDTRKFLLHYLEDLRTDENAPLCADPAFIIWNLYMMYGDETILSENYDLMKRWTDAVSEQDARRTERRYLYDFGTDYSDLPHMDEQTDPVFLASAFYYESARLIAEAAKELGNSEDFFAYKRLAGRIKAAILEEFFTMTGRFALSSQEACIAALRFKLYADKDRLLKTLSDNLEKDRFESTCTPEELSVLFRTLSENGMPELAYDLLFNEKIEKGAGAAEFLYADMAGIQPAEPGFASVLLAPVPDGRLEYCFSTLKTAYGDIISNWNFKENGDLCFHFEIPAGMTAKIRLPYYPVCAAGGNEITVKSGSYDYSYMPSKKLTEEKAVDADS